MTLPIYPDRDQQSILGLGYNVKWTPTFFNQTQTTMSGASVTIALAQYPLHTFELTYEVLRSDLTVGGQLQTMLGFFLSVGGSLGRFLFFNEDDNYPQHGHQAIGTGDGSTDTFIVVRSFGNTGGGFGTEPVGYVQQATPLEDWAPTVYPGITATEQVFVNGTLVHTPADYVIDNSFPGSPRIAFTSAPGAGQTIAADFGFYYYCRFADDSSTWEKFASTYWLNSTVKLQSCRQGA
ncbi:MAG TPA: DUF2460 domain-containing protein [Vicinamibacterales bacterium]|jgi:hypothetical protein